MLARYCGAELRRHIISLNYGDGPRRGGDREELSSQSEEEIHFRFSEREAAGTLPACRRPFRYLFHSLLHYFKIIIMISLSTRFDSITT